jgi:hypothetical protein
MTLNLWSALSPYPTQSLTAFCKATLMADPFLAVLVKTAAISASSPGGSVFGSTTTAGAVGDIPAPSRKAITDATTIRATDGRSIPEGQYILTDGRLEFHLGEGLQRKVVSPVKPQTAGSAWHCSRRWFLSGCD